MMFLGYFFFFKFEFVQLNLSEDYHLWICGSHASEVVLWTYKTIS